LKSFDLKRKKEKGKRKREKEKKIEADDDSNDNRAAKSKSGREHVLNKASSSPTIFLSSHIVDTNKSRITRY
jgi:hypothetical protein